MQKMKWITVLALCLAGSPLLAQSGKQVTDPKDSAPLDAQREKRALQTLSNIAEKLIISAVDVMPADKFGFTPADGEFKGVRTLVK